MNGMRHHTLQCAEEWVGDFHFFLLHFLMQCILVQCAEREVGGGVVERGLGKVFCSSEGNMAQMMRIMLMDEDEDDDDDVGSGCWG